MAVTIQTILLLQYPSLRNQMLILILINYSPFLKQCNLYICLRIMFKKNLLTALSKLTVKQVPVGLVNIFKTQDVFVSKDVRNNRLIRFFLDCVNY